MQHHKNDAIGSLLVAPGSQYETYHKNKLIKIMPSKPQIWATQSIRCYYFSPFFSMLSQPTEKLDNVMWTFSAQTADSSLLADNGVAFQYGYFQ